MAASVLIQRPHLTTANWLFMAGTGVLEAGYFQFLQAGYRLMMHGLDCEALHGWLRSMKRAQAAGQSVFGAAPAH